MKYLDASLTKHLWDLCAKNYKTMMKNITKCLREIHTVFMGWKTPHIKDGNSLSNLYTDLVQLYQIMQFLSRHTQNYPKLIWKGSETRIAKTILKTTIK